MNDNENIKALKNLHNRILNDASFLQKVNHGELSALFHIRRILECQDAEIERLNLENLQMVAKIKNLKSEAYYELAKRLEQIFANNTDISATGYQSLIGDIDNLLKEMTEQTTFEKLEHNSLCETETYKGGE